MADTDGTEALKRATKALAAKKSELRTRGLELLVDFALDQRLDALVDPDDAVGVVRGALAEADLAALMARHARPAWERQHAALESSGVRLVDALDDDARTRIEELVEGMPTPKARWARDAVDPKLVRQLLVPVVQELLVGFSKRLEALIGGGGGGVGGAAAARGRKAAFALGDAVRARVEKRAGQVLDAGRLVLGGLGVDLDARVQELIREVSQAMTDELRAAFVARVKSEEGRRIVRQMRGQVIGRILETPLHEITGDVEPPWDDLEPLAADLARELATRDALAEAIREELVAALAVDGDRSLRDLLGELGVLERVRELAVARLDPLARDLVKSKPAQAWLEALLATAHGG